MLYEFDFDTEGESIESAAYYVRHLIGLGRRFGREVQGAINLILDNPSIGTPIEGDIRCVLLGTFPYSIVYSIEDQLIFVLAIAHGSRKPGYWRSRVVP